MRAASLRPPRRAPLKDYTLERLKAEGKVPSDAPALYVAPSTPAEGAIESSDIASRLEQRFGLGDDAGKRRALYRRIQRLCEARGKEIELWVLEVVDKATGANDPGRYFSAAIVRVLRQAEVYRL